MHKDGRLDMNSYEHRQLVLRSTCEYSKIHQRLRYLMLMQSGNINGIKAELDKKMKEIERSLANQPKLKQLVDQYKARVGEVHSTLDTVSAVRAEVDKAHVSFNRFGDDNQLRCSTGRVLAKDLSSSVAAKANKLVSSIAAKYPLSDATGVEALQVSQSRLEKRIREEVLPENSGMKAEDCAYVVGAWLKNASLLVARADASVRARQVALQAMLRREPEYNAWSKRVSSIESDRILLSKVVDFMRVRTAPGSAIARAELIQREQQIRATLFGTNTIWNRAMSLVGRNRSLVGDWLRHSNSLYLGALSSFDKEFASLDRAVYQPIVSSWTSKYSWMFQKHYDELKLLTLKNIPRNSVPWNNACRRLDDIHINWLRAQDHQDATQFFCDAIKDIISNDVEPIIVKTCLGGLDLKKRGERRVKREEVSSKYLTLRVNHATIVQAKRVELQCPTQVPNE